MDESSARRRAAREPRARLLPGFDFSQDAGREAAAFLKRTGEIIKLITVQEILDEQ